MRITFIGGGNMAAALIAGLHQQGHPDLQLHVVDRNEDKCRRFAEQHGASWSLNVSEADLQADVVVLAIKPQGMAALAEQIRPWLHQQLLISVAAGIRTSTLSQWLGDYRQLVWVMPNTPAQIQRGVSGVYAMPEVQQTRRTLVDQLLAAVGTTVWLDDENRMDALTAISGCGPAYVFLMVEALAEAARKLGFSDADASQLAGRTFEGAIALLAHSGEDPASLRQKVTSKKGVTEQGILSLQADGLAEIVCRATERAQARSVEMGTLLSQGAQA